MTIDLLYQAVDDISELPYYLLTNTNVFVNKLWSILFIKAGHIQ
ncbi:hypothetical protein CI610_02598 [invertebrate metagenome]|uniref:Uncharacterized protein n=1 Tax=invertebrate metagenome TaxID=1711999 RepID=A0A2H9T5G4_9ZZZZ